MTPPSRYAGLRKAEIARLEAEEKTEREAKERAEREARENEQQGDVDMKLDTDDDGNAADRANY